MGWLGGLTGALGGFAAGGLPGAVAGGAAGFMGGGGAQQQWMEPRKLNPNELAAYQQAYQAMQANGQGMTPEQANAYIAQQRGTYFDGMTGQINQGYGQAMGRAAAQNARGGMLGSSRAMAANRGIAADKGNALSQAYANAQNMAEQNFLSREQNRRANVGTAQGTIGMINNARYGQGGTSFSQAPYNAASPGMGMMGMGMTDSNSYWNTTGKQKVNGWLSGAGQAVKGWLGYGGGGGGTNLGNGFDPSAGIWR